MHITNIVNNHHCFRAFFKNTHAPSAVGSVSLLSAVGGISPS